MRTSLVIRAENYLDTNDAALLEYLAVLSITPTDSRRESDNFFSSEDATMLEIRATNAVVDASRLQDEGVATRDKEDRMSEAPETKYLQKDRKVSAALCAAWAPQSSQRHVTFVGRTGKTVKNLPAPSVKNTYVHRSDSLISSAFERDVESNLALHSVAYFDVTDALVAITATEGQRIFLTSGLMRELIGAAPLEKGFVDSRAFVSSFVHSMVAADRLESWSPYRAYSATEERVIMARVQRPDSNRIQIHLESEAINNAKPGGLQPAPS
jgi:hypothetical protein